MKMLDAAYDFVRRKPGQALLLVLVVFALPPLAFLCYRTLDLIGKLFRLPASAMQSVRATVDKLLDWKIRNPWLFWAGFVLLFSGLPGLLVLALVYAALDQKKTEVWTGGSFSATAPGATGPEIGPLLPGQTRAEGGSEEEQYTTGYFGLMF